MSSRNSYYSSFIYCRSVLQRIKGQVLGTYSENVENWLYLLDIHPEPIQQLWTAGKEQARFQEILLVISMISKSAFKILLLLMNWINWSCFQSGIDDLGSFLIFHFQILCRGTYSLPLALFPSVHLRDPPSILLKCSW